MHLITKLKSKFIFKQDGLFTLKSGETSSYYFNFKELISHPSLLAAIAYELTKLITDRSNVALVAVPQGAVPVTVMMSYMTPLPQMQLRNEKKQYGMQTQIEGLMYDKVIIIEDVITTGSSVFAAIDILKQSSISVVQIIGILDRQAGGVEKLREFGYNVTTLYQLDDFVREQLTSLIPSTCGWGYQLLELSQRKQTKLIVSVDCENALQVMDIVGPHVCAIKLHRDLFEHLHIETLIELKLKHQFLIIEDRKFADIPYIALKQLQFVKKYADMVTVHGMVGSTLCEALGKEMPILIVHKMTVDGHLMDDIYQMRVSDFKCHNLVGFISPNKVKNHLTISTGINLDVNKDQCGQIYKPKSDADLFIVGRGIYEANNVLQSTLRYKSALNKI